MENKKGEIIQIMFCERLFDWFQLFNLNVERRQGVKQEAIKRFKKEVGWRVINNVRM